MEATGSSTGRRSLAAWADDMMTRPPGASPGTPRRVRLRLSGAVQGVGMRPFVHRLAAETGLAGFVRNGTDGVTIEVEGSRIADFISRLSTETPPLARIDALAIETLAPAGDAGFSIGASTGGRAATRVVPDAATCPDCLAELFDPASRFFGYPFTNCTQCGPRHTITRRLPYDRGRTAMAGFTMCSACAADYADPRNRRFHAEPIACPSCGPRLSHAISAIAALLRDGRIVALKGTAVFIRCATRATRRRSRRCAGGNRARLSRSRSWLPTPHRLAPWRRRRPPKPRSLRAWRGQSC